MIIYQIIYLLILCLCFDLVLLDSFYGLIRNVGLGFGFSIIIVVSINRVEAFIVVE